MPDLPLPFFDHAMGTYSLPPLTLKPVSSSRSSSSSRTGHSRQSSHSSSFTSRSSPSYSPELPPLASLSLSSRSPSPAPCSPIAPRVPHKTRPSHTRSRSALTSPASKALAPAFKLVPQPMLDPSKRRILKTDALVVFPETTGISQASQRKAKLLVGDDIVTFFELQKRQGALGARAYAYKMVYERRWSQSFETVLSRAGALSSSPSSVTEEIMDCE